MKKNISNYRTEIMTRLEEKSELWRNCQILKESINYTLLNYGKFIRSIIFLLGLEEFNIFPDKYLDVACAIEMLQSYTLIHDDLPEMDNATTRRNKVANHLIYGHSIALLSGDALLTNTFFVLSKLKINKDHKLALISLFAEKAGTSGVCYGQTLDILNQNTGFQSWNEIEQMIGYKTCCLFELAFQAIGIIANLGQEKLDNLEKLGYLYGLAFQIKDDLEDDQDTKNQVGYMNYQQIFGITKTKDKINHLIEKIKEVYAQIFKEHNTLLSFLEETLKVKE